MISFSFDDLEAMSTGTFQAAMLLSAGDDEGRDEDARMTARIEEALRDPTHRLRLHLNSMRCRAIDSEIGRLTGLRELRCHDNERLVTLPHTLHRLGATLTIIDASRCALETLPEELNELGALRHLSLAGNRLRTFLWDCRPLIQRLGAAAAGSTTGSAAVSFAAVEAGGIRERSLREVSASEETAAALARLEATPLPGWHTNAALMAEGPGGAGGRTDASRTRIGRHPTWASDESRALPRWPSVVTGPPTAATSTVPRSVAGRTAAASGPLSPAILDVGLGYVSPPSNGLETTQVTPKVLSSAATRFAAALEGIGFDADPSRASAGDAPLDAPRPRMGSHTASVHSPSPHSQSQRITSFRPSEFCDPPHAHPVSQLGGGDVSSCSASFNVPVAITPQAVNRRLPFGSRAEEPSSHQHQNNSFGSGGGGGGGGGVRFVHTGAFSAMDDGAGTFGTTSSGYSGTTTTADGYGGGTNKAALGVIPLNGTFNPYQTLTTLAATRADIGKVVRPARAIAPTHLPPLLSTGRPQSGANDGGAGGKRQVKVVTPYDPGAMAGAATGIPPRGSSAGDAGAPRPVSAMKQTPAGPLQSHNLPAGADLRPGAAFTNLEFLDLSGNALVYLSPSAMELVALIMAQHERRQRHNFAPAEEERALLLLPNDHLLQPRPHAKPSSSTSSSPASSSSPTRTSSPGSRALPPTHSYEDNRRLQRYIPPFVDRCSVCQRDTHVAGPTVHVQFVTMRVPPPVVALERQIKECDTIGEPPEVFFAACGPERSTAAYLRRRDREAYAELGIAAGSLRRPSEGLRGGNMPTAILSSSLVHASGSGGAAAAARRSSVSRSSKDGVALISAERARQQMRTVRVPCFHAVCGDAACSIALHGSLSRQQDNLQSNGALSQ